MESEPEEIMGNTPKNTKSIAARKIKEETKKETKIKPKKKKKKIKRIFEYLNED